jgi:hypothetical protein
VVTTVPTKRTRQSRGRQGAINSQMIAMYRRLYEIEHFLPKDAQEKGPLGEADMLKYNIAKHFDLMPWMPYEDFIELGDRLAAAAGLTRRSDNAYSLV